uniref:Zygote arrest 1-like n=1 Tax=Poecilia reticulata TaxID=8081 RepID=A0A3P9P1V5_POERE
MEGFLSTFLPCSGYGAPPAQGGSWGKGDGRFLIPQGLNYLEICKTILSQVNPSLPPPPCGKVDTKECGVQVNAKVDKVVQCSLGPKTLLCVEHPASCSSCDTHESLDVTKAEGKALLATPPMSNLRFLRPVSIYSPVFDRRVFLKSLGDGAGQDPVEASDQAKSDADTDHSGDNVENGVKTTIPRASKSPNFQVGFRQLVGLKDPKLSKIRYMTYPYLYLVCTFIYFFFFVCVKFLEQRYGFFHCKKCNIRWESAYVWCISGSSKVYYKQLCRKCQVGFNPYRVESIVCKGCSQTCCSCEKKQRHINMKRPHRKDLCCRCKGMRLSCDATYSFKYIV